MLRRKPQNFVYKISIDSKRVLNKFFKKYPSVYRMIWEEAKIMKK